MTHTHARKFEFLNRCFAKKTPNVFGVDFGSGLFVEISLFFSFFFVLPVSRFDVFPFEASQLFVTLNQRSTFFGVPFRFRL